MTKSLFEYYTDEEKVKFGIKTEKVTKENEEQNNEQINELNGIVEIIYGNEIYRTWKVTFIRPFIIKFLKDRHPDSLISREINKIDITVFDYNKNIQIPVEIQKVPISEKRFHHTSFEQLMRKQIEDLIENYKKCWLFIDAEYLRFLQYGNIGKNISINMIWLIKLMKKDKLKVFAIKYDGIVKELTTKDFDFLKGVSQICPIGYENDERILNRNKLEIYHNIMKGYNFTQDEITQFENEFDNRIDESINSSEYFMKSDNKKCILYGYILDALGRLSNINNNLDCKSNKNIRILSSVTLGLFYQNEFSGQSNHASIQFIDKFNIAQYFPGYLRNKEMWNYCKTKQRVLTMNEFRGIIEGREHCLKLIKQQSKSLADYN